MKTLLPCLIISLSCIQADLKIGIINDMHLDLDNDQIELYSKTNHIAQILDSESLSLFIDILVMFTQLMTLPIYD